MKSDGQKKKVITDDFNSNIDVEVNVNNVIENNVELKTKDDQAVLEIPENTMLQDSEGNVPEAFTVNVLILPVSDISERAIIQAYEFGPEGAIFDPPVTLILNYDPEALPPGAQETDLTLAGWDGTRWTAIESQVDTLLKTVSAKISQFGKYALLAPVMMAQSAKVSCSD